MTDSGAPLTGACRPANTGGGRFCRGRFDGVDVSLGDGDDSLTSGVGGSVDGGPGDDQIHTGGAFSTLSGGPGADLLDATASQGAAVTYADHTDGVTVRLNGVADDGAAGEGDNVLGPVTGITGGSGNDDLQAGRHASGLFGGAGNDVLTGSPEGDTINAGDGNDTVAGGDGNDHLDGRRGRRRHRRRRRLRRGELCRRHRAAHAQHRRRRRTTARRGRTTTSATTSRLSRAGAGTTS